MAIYTEDDCLGCETCSGRDSCRYMHQLVMECDKCKNDTNILYRDTNGKELCEDCLLDQYRSTSDIPIGEARCTGCQDCINGECPEDTLYFDPDEHMWVCADVRKGDHEEISEDDARQELSEQTFDYYYDDDDDAI